MNDYNVSPEATALVNDSPFVPDPLAYSQYTLQSLKRVTIILNVNRLNGEFFPFVDGNFMVIDTCDAPVTITPGSTNNANEFYGAEGYEYRGPFKGIYIQHADYSAFTNGTLRLSILVGDSDVSVGSNLDRPQTARNSQSMAITTTTGAGGNTFANFPLPRSVKFLEYGSFYSILTLTGAIVGDIAGTAWMLGATGLPLSNAASTLGFNGRVVKANVMTWNAATFQYLVGFEVNRVAIPSHATSLRLQLLVNPINNLASASSGGAFSAGSGPIGCAYFG
jgi:hypothetical protein